MLLLNFQSLVPSHSSNDPNCSSLHSRMRTLAHRIVDSQHFDDDHSRKETHKEITPTHY